MTLKLKSYWLIIFFLVIAGCTGKSGPSGRSARQTQPAGQTISGMKGQVASEAKGQVASEAKISKVTFYIENSESMFGYVSTITDYVDVISELAEKPEFVMDRVPGEFYFVNGAAPVLTPIGDNPSVLKNRLNRVGFKCGDITKSNLNGMFQVALKNVAGGAISILISDGIYDIGGAGVTSLVTEGKGTRSQFINRLMAGDLQTIIIKLRSQFNGDYFFTSQKGKTPVNGIRPYYIWILGDSRILNKYFPNEYISEKLKGYQDMARFMKPGTSVVPYQATADNSAGTFKFDHRILNRLNDAKSDSHGLGFQFSIAVDYSKLPYPEPYLTNPGNYSAGNNYTIVSIKKPAGKIHSVAFTPTHLITVKTMKNPGGQLEVSLVNNLPEWIRTTHTDTEENIRQDKTHTYGFNYLTDGIIQAYESVSEDKSIASFNIDIH